MTARFTYPADMSVRVFAALPIPDDTARELKRLQKGVPGARWRPVENFHITLRFFGEVEETRLDDLDGELSSVILPPFPFELRHASWFGKTDPHTLWMGVDAGESLQTLHRACEKAARKVGLKAETRNFTPHVTLAYLHNTPTEKLRRFVDRTLDYGSGRLMARYFSLYRSFPRRGEANIYEPVSDYPLA